MSSWTLCGLCVLFLIGLGVASDVPFVFDKNISGVANYTSDQLEQGHILSPELAGVPSISTPSDNSTLNFPVVGGGRTPQGTSEKKVADLRKLFDGRVEPENSKVHEKALVLVAKYPGDYTVDQICSIYEYLKDGWHYVGDPRGVNNFFYANETLNVGEKANCAGVGDCGDFAILMSALVESIGGTTRIVLASNNTTGGHAYAEVYLGQINSPNNQVDAIINWLKQDFEIDKIFVNINTSTKEVWLNLDWSADHPGGPFFPGNKNIVLHVRENYPKVPLNLPEKANKPPKLISLTSDKPSPQDTGTVVTWTAEAKDPENDQIFYKFFLNDNPVTKWITDNTWAWNTNDTDVDENQIEVQVRDGKHAGPAGFDDRKSSSFNITAHETEPIATTTVTRPSPSTPIPVTVSTPTIPTPTIPTPTIPTPGPSLGLVNGGVYHLKCLGDIEGNRWLDGRTQDGSVGLAPTTEGVYTGTKWQAIEVEPGIYHLKCLGDIEGNRWLDGRTQDGSVGLAPTTEGVYTGTKWQAIEVEPGIYHLKCLGDIEGNRWLDGRTQDGSVGLAPTTEGVYTGTKWQAEYGTYVTGQRILSTGGSCGVQGIVGTWSWFNGGTVTINSDGTINALGTWEQTDVQKQSYTLNWNNGQYIDKLILSADCNSLAGYNQDGTHVAGRRILSTGGSCGVQGIVGTWSWFNGGTVTINSDGTINSGTWEQTDAQKQSYTLNWNNGQYIDKLNLSADCNSLAGYNQDGTYVTGQRK